MAIHPSMLNANGAMSPKTIQNTKAQIGGTPG